MSIYQEWKLCLSFILLFFICASISVGQSTWELINPPPTGRSLGSVTYGKGKFVVVGYCDSVLTSPDGKTWSKSNLPPGQSLKSVTYGDSLSDGPKGLFVAVGDPFAFITSPDGMTWTTISLPTIQDLSNVTYGNGRFIAVSYDYAFSISTDGIAWTRKSLNFNQVLFFVTYCNGQFVALDNSMGIMKNPNDWPQLDTNKILTSVDGSSWTMQKMDPIIDNNTRPFNSVTYGNTSSANQAGQFVAVGFIILTSPDGTVWTKTYSNTTIDLWSVIFGNGQFVAVGDSGTILTSPDGIAWTQQNSGTTNTLFSVTYADGIFVAVGDNGTILTSKADPVGIAFQPKAKPNISSLKINISKNCISALLPTEISCSQLKVGLFNISGKQIYSATFGTQNGILNIPVKQFPAGKYFMSITDENKRTLNSGFVLTR